MPSNTDDDFVGARVRYWRTRRLLSQTALAGLAGVSQGYVSQVEAGVKDIDKRSTLIRLANALQVSVADLTLLPGPEFAEHTAADATIPAIRGALNEIRLGGDPRPGRTVTELQPAVDELEPLWRTARYDRLGRLLPGILADLHAVCVTDQCARHDALRLMVRAARAASPTLTRLGYIDLAMIAADVGHTAAEELGEPAWTGVAIFNQLHSLPIENKTSMRRLAVIAADQLSAHTGDPEALQVYGMLHLTAAFSAAICERPDEARSHLTEARAIAEHTGECQFAELRFGPTNIGFWETSIAVELGEGGRVREIGQRIEPDRIGSETRKSDYWVDFGRGLAQTHRDGAEAIAYFVRAERAAPQRARLSAPARSVIGTMLRRARRGAGGAQLRELAQRFGVA